MLSSISLFFCSLAIGIDYRDWQRVGLTASLGDKPFTQAHHCDLLLVSQCRRRVSLRTTPAPNLLKALPKLTLELNRYKYYMRRKYSVAIQPRNVAKLTKFRKSRFGMVLQIPRLKLFPARKRSFPKRHVYFSYLNTRHYPMVASWKAMSPLHNTFYHFLNALF